MRIAALVLAGRLGLPAVAGGQPALAAYFSPRGGAEGALIRFLDSLR